MVIEDCPTLCEITHRERETVPYAFSRTISDIMRDSYSTDLVLNTHFQCIGAFDGEQHSLKKISYDITVLCFIPTR